MYHSLIVLAGCDPPGNGNFIKPPDYYLESTKHGSNTILTVGFSVLIHNLSAWLSAETVSLVSSLQEPNVTFIQRHPWMVEQVEAPPIYQLVLDVSNF